MNPILKSRQSITVYGLCVLLYAVLYTGLFTSAFPSGPGFGWISGALTWLLFSLAGIALWNVLRYAVPDTTPVIRRFIVIAYGFFTVAAVCGTEIFAAYLSFPECLGNFARGIPLRIFSTVLAYLALVLWYETDATPVSQKSVASPAHTRMHSPASEAIERITVRVAGKIKIIGVEEIDLITAAGDYVSIATQEGRWLKEQTMKYFEENLPAGMFVRIHRSYLVALNRIVRIERYGKLYRVTLRNGEKLKVSAVGYKLLKDSLRL